MREQLKLLEELQRHDARLQEHETSLHTLPEKLHLLQKDLERIEAMLAKERADLAETERFRLSQDTQLKTEEGNIAKAKAKLQQVRTGKDYMAAQREIEATRRMVGEREEEVLKLIEVIETAKKNIAAHEADVAKLREVVEAEEQTTSVKLADLQKLADEARVARDVVARKVRPDLLKRYSSIRMRRGLAVVPVVNGVCQGCHMSIPPQLYNTLQRANSIETCPTCYRLIYWDEIMKEQQLEAGEATAVEKSG